MTIDTSNPDLQSDHYPITIQFHDQLPNTEHKLSIINYNIHQATNDQQSTSSHIHTIIE